MSHIVDKPQLELSTKLIIEAAQKRGIQVAIIDPWTNLICLKQSSQETSGNVKIEFLKQANISHYDSYLSYELMADKHLSKLFLQAADLRVAQGSCFYTLEEALAQHKEVSKLSPDGFVVKPTNTNFGLAITHLSADAPIAAYRQALEEAFAASLGDGFLNNGRVIVEEFVRGLEFRFLVIGDECVAACHRVPAHVMGDGHAKIRQLVEEKNKDPRRGVGHTTPLEKIKLGQTELSYLHSQDLTLDSVPDAGTSVFLRPNSNVNTGGEAIDYTTSINPFYKEVAVRATQSMQARVCGVDLIVPGNACDTKNHDYSILEVNFNPTLYIHAWPVASHPPGLAPPPIGDKLLDLLGFSRRV